MAGHPLLIFPESTRAVRVKRRPVVEKLLVPSVLQQTERLFPQFQRLQEAMEHQRATLYGDTLGLQPEQVLVLETIGSIDNFIQAVNKIEGLEWLGEYESEGIVPEYGFQEEGHPEKELGGQLFLVMTDQRALQELQSLFNRWKEDPTAKFSRGQAPLKKVFHHLHSIRPWDEQDRIRDTGLFEDWRERANDQQQIVPFEVEIWFRRNLERRGQAETFIRNLVTTLGGEVVQQCVIPEINYHSLLGKIPVGKASEIISLSDVRLLQCQDVMYLRPVGQCAVPLQDDQSELGFSQPQPEDEFPNGYPVIALLDGLPLSGHRLLERRLSIDDPDDFADHYQVQERIHGTSMASLICHGDLLTIA